MDLAAALLEHGVSHEHALRLAAYAQALLETNRRYNLTAAESLEELLPHLLDSLTLVPFVSGPLIDIGSGGGLPAIPIGIVTGVAVTMVESTLKKAAFLRDAAREVGLEAMVVGKRAETAAHEEALRGGFQTATARAVSSAPTVAELTVPFLASGGAALLQRGALEDRERNAAADAAPMLGAILEREVDVAPGRRILILRKTAPTPLRFPRRIGVPEKRPLCW